MFYIFFSVAAVAVRCRCCLLAAGISFIARYPSVFDSIAFHIIHFGKASTSFCGGYGEKAPIAIHGGHHLLYACKNVFRNWFK